MRKYILDFILILALISIMSNCKPKPVELEVVLLSLERIDYLGNELKIGGYYFFEYTTSENVTYVQIYFLYKNGIISGLTNNVINKNEIILYEENVINGNLYSNNKEDVVY